MATEQEIEAIARKYWPAPNWTIEIGPNMTAATHGMIDPQIGGGFALLATRKDGLVKLVAGKTLDELKANVEQLIAEESKPYG